MALSDEFAGANQKYGGRPQRFKLDNTSECYYIGSEVIYYSHMVYKLPVMWTIFATLLYISLISPDKYNKFIIILLTS